MKRFITALAALFTLTVAVNAMSYEQAREQALFLTDKMAYELNLTEEQYDAAYEINLDYLMSINTPDDLYEIYWRQRNLDFSYILMDWQYRAFCAASYFYRPLYWTDGLWHFAIYAHYPRRNYFYFGRPNIYITYRGGHGWHHNGGRSWYKGRSFNHGGIDRGHGMRDRYDRGEFKNDRHEFRNDRHEFRNDRHENFNRDNNRGGNFNGNRSGNFNGNRGGNSNSNNWNRNEGARTELAGKRVTQRTDRGNVRINRESSTRTTAKPGFVEKSSQKSSSVRTSPFKTQQRSSGNSFAPKQSNSRPSVSRGTGTRVNSSSVSRGGGNRGGSPKGGNNGNRGNFGGKR